MEIDLRMNKWIINCTYNAYKSTISTHIVKSTKFFDFFSSNYEKVIIIEHFNAQANDNHMKSFCDNHGLKNVTNQSKYYKNLINPAFIDPIFTNASHSFQSTLVIGKRLSDFCMMNVTTIRKEFKK